MGRPALNEIAGVTRTAMSMGQLLTINSERLRKNFDELSSIGARGADGLFRMAFTPEDMEARGWLEAKIEEAGLVCRIDGAANVSALLPGRRPNQAAVLTGSHLDTVPGGGPLDGALGVLTGLESLQSLKEQGVSLSRSVELINFSDEEGRFGGLLGSQAITGELTGEHLREATDLNGVSLTEAMSRHSLDPLDALGASRPKDSIHAFVELHIEQGPVLEQEGRVIGVVEGFAGLFKWEISLLGQPAHSGTTPMSSRRDALQGLGRVLCGMESVLETHGSATSVCNIGRVEALPGAANVVPGKVDFSLEVRDVDASALDRLRDRFRQFLQDVAAENNLDILMEVVSEISPQPCAKEIVETVHQVAEDLQHPLLRMPSGAVHDSQIMGKIAPSGIFFVPSRGGRSHCPEEWTEWSQIEAGCQVLINTLYRLANS